MALATGFLHRVEGHALGGEALDQLGQVLLVASVAGAGRVPEVHQADRPLTGEVLRQAQVLAGEDRGPVVEGADVARFVPAQGQQDGADAGQEEEAGQQGLESG
ncbi:hypothetical protein D3C72_2105600 [compost metagenome]